jgi:hypothetical protein
MATIHPAVWKFRRSASASCFSARPAFRPRFPRIGASAMTNDDNDPSETLAHEGIDDVLEECDQR